MSDAYSTEIWKTVPQYGGHYEASNFGRIRSKDRIVVRKHSSSGSLVNFFYKGRLLNPSTSKYGHKHVHIGFEKEKINVGVHRLVLFAFVGPCPEGMECCHNNGISDDNRPENLRWDTHKANNADRKMHGMYSEGENHHMAKLSNETVLEIRASGLNGPQVSKKYGIGTSQAHRILTFKSRKIL